MHTPVGVINVTRWNYGLDGFVALIGEDENKEYRFIVFPEEQFYSFPVEVTRKGKKGKSSSKKIGFATTTGDDTTEEA